MEEKNEYQSHDAFEQMVRENSEPRSLDEIVVPQVEIREEVEVVPTREGKSKAAKYSIAALVLSIVGIIITCVPILQFGLILFIVPSIVLGAMAIKKREEGDKPSVKTMGIVAIVLSVLSIALFAGMMSLFAVTFFVDFFETIFSSL